MQIFCNITKFRRVNTEMMSYSEYVTHNVMLLGITKIKMFLF
jgi:hypothetical protein